MKQLSAAILLAILCLSVLVGCNPVNTAGNNPIAVEKRCISIRLSIWAGFGSCPSPGSSKEKTSRMA